MNDFKGLSRDTSVIKTPEQMWQFARNILLTNKYLSITNEKGNEYGYEIPGVVVGYIITNDDIVYLSLDGNYSCIGYVNQYNQVYTSVLRTTNPSFKFKLNCPIEGVYVYNYKKELVIVFSDGVNQDSSTPKLINLHNPQVQLSPNKEFINSDDYIMFELFNYTELPTVSFNYEIGALVADVVHLAFCYVYDDNTEGLYSPIINSFFPNYRGDNTIKHNIVLNLTNFSSKYKKVKLAFIIKKDNSLFAYKTSNLSIVNNSLKYTLTSEELLESITVDEVIFITEYFNKIKTITKTANRIVIGNVSKDKPIDIQKYVNKLVLKCNIIAEDALITKYKTHPYFLPDEVYNFKLVPIFLDGREGEAFHIPGRKAKGTELSTLQQPELGLYGLNFEDIYNKTYKKFHFENTGTINPCDWGYWENEELYPNENRYNSSDIGGEDLRDTPIRYHRFPSLENNTLYNSYNINCNNNKNDENIGKNLRFYISILNFDDVFPIEIKKQLQGYKLVFEKRIRGNTYIEETGILFNHIVTNYIDKGYSLETEQYGKLEGYLTSTQDFKDFSVSKFVSPNILTYKPTIIGKILKIYKPIKLGLNIIGQEEDKTDYENTVNITYIEKKVPIITNFKFAYIDKYEYLIPNNIASNNRFGTEDLKLTLKQNKGNNTDTKFIPLLDGDNSFNSLAASIISLNKNIYNFKDNTDYICCGTYLLNKNTLNDIVFVNGDCFLTTTIKKAFTGSYGKYLRSEFKIATYSSTSYYCHNIYSAESNGYILNGNFGVNVKYNARHRAEISTVYSSWRTAELNTLNSFDYQTTIKNNKSKLLNDFISYLPLTILDNKINYFPYRVHKGLAIPNESLQTKNLRFFPTNSYYDMRNDRGEIIALRGYNRGLYIQQRYSLFESYIADKLNATAEETYLGSSELFDRIPEEILYNDNIGYIGSNSQFACIIFRDGYATVDEEQGKVFIINKGLSEISQQNLKNYFRQALPLGNKYTKKDLLGNTVKVDNPFSSIGYLIGFDEEYNRLILTKKYYTPKNNTIDLSFDGEFYYDERDKKIDFDNESYFINESKTFSFALDSKSWVCEHDYFPNAYLYNNKGFFLSKSVIGGNTKIYKHNSNKVNPGNFFEKQYQSYVDLIFNGRLDISKQYQALNWVSESFDISTNTELQFDTIDKVMFYNNHQCSGYIEVSKTDLKTSRNAEGIWQLNEFRDMLISPDKKILNDDGNLITNNISLTKQWFNKGMFFGNFIVVRMLWDNTTKVLKHIHNVNVKSVLSQR